VKPTLRWRLPEPPTIDTRSIAAAAGIPELAVRLLASRDLTTPEAIKAFLDPSPAGLRKPDALPDIDVATKRIVDAIEKHERILVYGDYDVDGVTGTALLVSVLQSLGADVLYYLPARETEGYGFSLRGVEFGRDNGVKLVVTNDCGSGDFASVRAARAAGIDVIVTDHHEFKDPAGGEPLPALALVNPKRPDSTYPFRELAGVGVAFKLAWSILSTMGRTRDELVALLDLVGLGTIADVVPLVEENRIIARLGLTAIRRSTRPGIRALLDVARVKDRLSSYAVGFMLAPRINAAGRVGRADKAVRLLLTDDPTEARAIAGELDEMNRARQAIEVRIFSQAMELVAARQLSVGRAIVVAGEDWHEGVIGIVASKLTEEFYRPCIVVSLKKDRGKGSGRSITGFNLHEALQHCAGHLLGYGGHRYAAGLTLERHRLPDFETALNEYAARLPDEIYQPSLQVDAVASLDDIDDELVATLDRFEPFGPDNKAPVLAALGLEVVGYPRKVGRDQNHLKLRLRSGTRVFDAIAWDRSSELLNITVGQKGHLDVCFTVDRNTYNGTTSTQLTIRDLCTSTAPD